MSPKRRPTSAKRPETTTGTERPRRSDGLLPQPHGGAIWAGAPANPVPGPGRPPSLVRQRLRGAFTDRIDVLEDIADGVPVESIEVPLSSVLPHARCPKCTGPLLPADEAKAVLLTVTARRSARPGDRTKALDVMAKYSIGAVKGVSEEELDAFAKQIAEVVFEVCGREMFERVSARLAEVRRGVDAPAA